MYPASPNKSAQVQDNNDEKCSNRDWNQLTILTNIVSRNILSNMCSFLCKMVKWNAGKIWLQFPANLDAAAAVGLGPVKQIIFRVYVMLW